MIEILLQQEKVIAEMYKLLDDLIAQLAQYKNVDEEEQLLRDMEDKK